MKKDFCRLITDHELSESELSQFLRTVNQHEIVAVADAYLDGEFVGGVDLIAYETYTGKIVYEVTLKDQLNMDQGESISTQLDEIFDFDFDFEISLEI
jgi:hypothetical protein